MPPPLVEAAPLWASRPFRERPFRSKSVNGKQRLSRAEFRKHFGPATWAVYCFDLRFRNSCIGREAYLFGECWQGAASVAKALSLYIYQVVRARGHLQSLGLERSRWDIRRGRKVYLRVVIGNFDPDGESLRVPQRVINELRARKRGGARPGSGPKKRLFKPAVVLFKPADDLLPSEEAAQTFASLASQASEDRAPGARSSVSSSAREVPMPVAQSLSEMLTSAPQPTRPPIPPAAQALIPPPPSDSQINAPLVPQPPDLPEDTSDDYEILSRAYSGSVRHVTGKKPSPFAKRHMTAAQLQRSLGESGKLLREHRLPPILWAVWSVRAFQALQQRDHPGRKRLAPPALSWVFNPKRIAKHHGWCRHEMGSELGGTLCIPPSVVELQRRWRLMRADIDRLASPTVESVGSVVDTWFPAGLYARLVARAAAEASAKREALAQGLARGDWIW